MKPMRMLAAALISLSLSTSSWSASFWFASDAQLNIADSNTGEVTQSYDLDHVSNLATSRDGRVFVLRGGHLELFGAESTAVATLDLASLGYPHATLLAINPYDDSMWIATSNSSLLHVDAELNPTGNYALPSTPRSAALDTDETLWIAGDQQLWHMSSAGKILATVAIPEIARSSRSLRVDAIGQQVWIAGEGGLVAVDVSNSTAPKIARAINRENVRGAVLHERTGVLWLLTASSLEAFNRDAWLASRIDLEPLGIRRPISVGFDSADEVILVGHSSGVTGFTAVGGKLFVTQHRQAVSNVSGAPWILAPVVSIESPSSGEVSSNRRPEIVLKVDALCNGMSCKFLPEYFAKYRVGVTLNGQVIDAAFTFDIKTGLWVYRPSAALHIGTYNLSACAIDAFGHRSKVVETHWTIKGETGTKTTREPSSPTNSSLISLASGGVTTQAAPAKNNAPTATLTAPQQGATFSTGSTITVSATASDTDGTVVRVDFLAGTTVIGTDSAAPYSIAWANVAAGNYSLTAKAVDNAGAIGTSAAVNISVVSNQPPSVSITAPSNQSTVAAGSTVQITATASDADGTVTSVQLYDGTTLLTTLTAPPFQFAWVNVPAGSHALSAKAIDNKGAVTTSATVNITAVAPPLVVITAPASCSRLDAPANVALSADAETAAGTIAKVEFFRDTTLIGTDTTRPFTVAVSGLASGNYTFSAKATDASGLATMSRAIQLSVGPPNVLPSVTLTNPANGATFGPSANITLSATASDLDGTIASVAFFADGAPVATDTTAPYSATWNSAPSGSHALTAVATDDRGGTTTSAPANITVNANTSPSVALTAPSSGATYYAPARIDLAANATDTDGTVAKVEFFIGATLVGTDTAAPFAVTATGVTAGNYSVTAKATDNLGAQSTSAPVSITVLPNNAPTVSITAPAGGSSFFPPATIRVSASAADSDGAIQRVEFYAGSTLIGTASSSPYSVVWDNVVAGNYVLSAVAVDDRGGATTSATVSVAILSGPSLTIIEPAVDPTSGIASGAGSVYVRGTVNAPPNSAVVVNGKIAIIDDAGQFHVNNVPLGGGMTDITATVTTQDGVSSSESIDVNDSGAAPFTVVPDSDWGLKQKQVIFTTTNPGTVPIARFEYDFNSDGIVDFTAHPSDFTNGELQLQLAYPQPGRYLGRVTAYDAQNQPIFTVKHAIIMKDPVPFGAMLQGVFNQMLERLRAGNVSGALTAVNATSKDQYSDVFTALLANSPNTVNQLGTIASGQVGEKFSEFVLGRDDASGSLAYLISLGRGEDGIWRIESM